jgi:hypothetical protein
VPFLKSTMKRETEQNQEKHCSARHQLRCVLATPKTRLISTSFVLDTIHKLAGMGRVGEASGSSRRWTVSQHGALRCLIGHVQSIAVSLYANPSYCAAQFEAAGAASDCGVQVSGCH